MGEFRRLITCQGIRMNVGLTCLLGINSWRNLLFDNQGGDGYQNQGNGINFFSPKYPHIIIIFLNYHSLKKYIVF